MKKYWKCLFIVIFSITSCQSSKDVIKGELFIKLIDFVNFYDFSDKDVKSFKEKMIKLKKKESISEEENEAIIYYDFLVDQNLLEKPYFKLKISAEEVITVFTNEEEYSQIKIYLDKIDREKEKVIIEIEGAKLKTGIYFADTITLETSNGVAIQKK